MEDDAPVPSGPRRKREGAQEREAGACRCQNPYPGVCDRVLTEDAARRHRFCSNECELAWLLKNSNRETYNNAFYSMSAKLPYMPMVEQTPGLRVADKYYPAGDRAAYAEVVRARTGKN